MELQARLKSRFADDILEFIEFRGDLTIEIPREKQFSILKALREEDDFSFDMLIDVIGLDNYPPPEGKPRFEVIYLLLATKTNERLRVKVRVPEDDPRLQSVTSIWKAADWPERETYDMFGIVFEGHHNLKRLLMWDEFPAHPLRKDYALEGQGEERVLKYR
ncbi:NADH-quinone oxidoreductase subunit C [Thermosulfuriphilus ammonigenes]|uniref:NADH-quinone oxidoreductase subunit C n=1 Tax=Thermosulfuriphilus ammonigenes TaxID=1936021 RepID=A0A6G7PSY2_9BACT|nr:NADH-quinone oxidoreductase subunit C [Thermosulfuriphilus ammonigenes]MBA2849169.1 NADH-quinone oxidoreductase subunit C [Thermosulfuriphilus ammonigenes]QIJ70785.1 NADH-quinone oxidoreductase subunit C [Thermosulfuriphilus ammonigenes]